MSFKPCVIHVGGNNALREAVQAALKAKGFTKYMPEFTSWHRAWNYVTAHKDGQFTAGDTDPEINPSLTRFDAATQFGALLEYLDKPEEVKVDCGVGGCNQVDVYADGVVLTFDGHRWSFRMSKEEIENLKTCVDRVPSQAARKEGK